MLVSRKKIVPRFISTIRWLSALCRLRILFTAIFRPDPSQSFSPS
ncbi:MULTISPECIES: hypothetical protein [unclassified Bradyrhizobium]|nr:MULTISPECIES: hypothetical protein [unclassified Bradyrhizobium]